METDLEKQDLDMQWSMQDKPAAPLVAVYMICYNCEPYIAQAIEGVMMQQTSFSLQLFIGDDASTDNTAAICLAYQKKYPDKISLLLHPKNIGAVNNAKSVYAACLDSGASYIAMCEGDDFWTDPQKLEKQVSLLDRHPQYAMCFHEAVLLDESTGQQKPYGIFTEDRFNTEAVLKKGAFVPTLSMVFRTRGLSFPHWYFHIDIGDIALVLMVSLLGDIVLIRENMGTYRWHNKGMSQKMEASRIALALSSVKLLHYFNLHTHFAYDAIIQEVNTATLYQLKHHTEYQNTRDTRSLVQKIVSPDFWLRKTKEILENRQLPHKI